jgi:hypothetical protein
MGQHPECVSDFSEFIRRHGRTLTYRGHRFAATVNGPLRLESLNSGQVYTLKHPVRMNADCETGNVALPASPGAFTPDLTQVLGAGNTLGSELWKSEVKKLYTGTELAQRVWVFHTR